VTQAGSFLAVARVAAAHGVKGEVRCELLTDFPERFRRTAQVYGGSERQLIAVERARLVKDGVLLKLAGIESRTDAERLRGMLLYVPEAEAVSLPSDTYFWHQIVGMRVRTTDGRDLGTVAEILPTGANDVYVVHRDGRELLLPAIRDVVQQVDLANGVMIVELIEGLE
jgi:16S rRNA processing protein RimM